MFHLHYHRRLLNDLVLTFEGQGRFNQLSEVTVNVSTAGAQVILSMNVKTNKFFLENLHDKGRFSNFLPAITEKNGRLGHEIKVDMDVRSLSCPIYIFLVPIIFLHFCYSSFAVGSECCLIYLTVHLTSRSRTFFVSSYALIFWFRLAYGILNKCFPSK